MSNVKLRLRYQNIDGILFNGTYNPRCVRETMSYKPTPDDVFIATYPKCGTTWMQNIALYIFRNGKELEDPDLLQLRTLCPFIDRMGTKGIECMPRPGCFKTHLPYSHVPYSPDAKYIYVLRNPKDCCVSMYYHTKSAQIRHGYEDITFDEFFEVFMAGEVEYNDYFDHLTSWFTHRNDKEVFFTTYEEMKEDVKSVVLKVASFLGREYIEAIERDNNVLNNILRFSGFDYMKKHLEKVFELPHKHEEEENSTKGQKILDNLPKGREKIDFIRKGIVGDWKNHFSDEQSERMNSKFIEKTQGTEIYDMYRSYMAI